MSSDEPASQANVTFGTNNTFQDSAVSIGDIVGRDKIVYTNQYDNHDLHDVHLLRDQNPYLGLHSFTYQDRGKYAGRQTSLQVALSALTTPGQERTLYAVTGASGSGKSSFVQAGLIPALESHATAQGLLLVWTVLRPGHQPFAALTGALRSLGAPIPPGTTLTAAEIRAVLPQIVHPTVLPILVIDQFEEVFTQADPAEATAVCAMLADLPAFATLRLHVLLTMRADFLPEAFAYPALYDQITQGLALRAMAPAELRAAIVQPLAWLLDMLAQQHPDRARQIGIKVWDDALLDRLCDDASVDPAYLPLLQVTLEDLFRRGSLTAGAYRSLTDAIGQHAETVYHWTDYAGAQQMPRPAGEQQRMLAIMRDLVQVSLDAAARRDVRQSRSLTDLVADDPAQAAMVETLVAARLLSTSQQTQADGIVVMVDIIHERLLRDWPRMVEAIRSARQHLQRRVRFEQALAEWMGNGEQDAYVLIDVRLAEAQILHRDHDVTTRDPSAQRLIARSVAVRDAAKYRQVRRAWRVAALLGMFAVVAVLAAGWALQASQRAAQERQEAEHQATVADAQRLVTLAQTHLDADPETAVLLAREAALRAENAETDAILRTSLANRPWPSQPLTTTGWLQDVAFRSDGEFFLTAIPVNGQRVIQLWSRTGTLQVTLPTMPPPPSLSPNGDCHMMGFDPLTNDLLTLTQDGMIQTWTMHGAPLGRRLEQRSTPLACFAIGADGRIASINAAGIVELWPPDGRRSIALTTVDGPVTTLSLLPDGALITVTTAGTAHRWNPDGTYADTFPQPFRGLPVIAVRSSHDGAATMLRSACGLVVVWMGATRFGLADDPNEPPYDDTECLTLDDDAFFGPDDRSLILISFTNKSIGLAPLGGDLTPLVTVTSAPYHLQQRDPFNPQAVYPNANGTAMVGVAFPASNAPGDVTPGGIRLWTNLPAVMTPVRDQILDVAMDRDRLLVRTSVGVLHLRDRAGQTQKTLAGHWDHAQFLPGSDAVLAWTPQHAQVWSPTAHIPTIVIEGADPIRQVVASPRGGYLLVTRGRSTGGITTEIWSRAGQQLQTVPQPPITTSTTPTIQIDAAEQVMLVADASGGFRWQLDGEALRHEERQRVAGASHRVQLSPDGQRIAIISEAQGVTLWEGGITIGLSGTADLGTINDLEWSPDSQSLLIGAADGWVQRWTASGQRVAAFQTASPLREVRWSPDQTRLITLGATTQIWTSAGALQTAVPKGGWNPDRSPKNTGNLDNLYPSPDGEFMAWTHWERDHATTVTITDRDGQVLQVLPLVWGRAPQIRWRADSQALEIVAASAAGSVMATAPVGRQALLDQVACTVTHALTPTEQKTFHVTPLAMPNQHPCPAVSGAK